MTDLYKGQHTILYTNASVVQIESQKFDTNSDVKMSQALNAMHMLRIHHIIHILPIPLCVQALLGIHQRPRVISVLDLSSGPLATG